MARYFVTRRFVYLAVIPTRFSSTTKTMGQPGQSQGIEFSAKSRIPTYSRMAATNSHHNSVIDSVTGIPSHNLISYNLALIFDTVFSLNYVMIQILCLLLFNNTGKLTINITCQTFISAVLVFLQCPNGYAQAFIVNLP